MGAQLRGKSRAAIQLADEKAEAELHMATDGFNREAPTTEDELLLAEHASHPRVNPSEVSLSIILPCSRQSVQEYILVLATTPRRLADLESLYNQIHD